MSNPLSMMSLWSRTLGSSDGPYQDQVEVLRQSLNDFRGRVSNLVSAIASELPGLTVHDITHLDALWRVAGEIAGPDYPINPAEAFVLGGAFLLHDAAHVMAAYEGGVDEIKRTVSWQDLIAQRFSGEEPSTGSKDEKAAIFQVLRHLHAVQAHNLATRHWTVPGGGGEAFLLENLQLRQYYGDLIGEIAASHHWSPEKVAETFKDRRVSPPGFLQPANWTVDALKIAFLLRTADAAHLDDQRAPWFLFALQKPEGISAQHWHFQAKMGQPTRSINGELILSAGAPFASEERRSWWLAFDTARMIDRELRSANILMRDAKCETFAAHGVMNVDSPESFSRSVRVRGWEPVNVGPSVGDLPRLISVLGGSALYGDEPEVALRELLQNALDAVRAFGKINDATQLLNRVDVSIQHESDDSWWLNVTDSGVGMSRYVLTQVLLDFGTSLWRSDSLREELPGLAKSGFEASGKFGIGFYSVFMLGDEVRVTSRRFERTASDAADQWQLVFEDGLNGRPLLTKPSAQERLQHQGTRVSVRMNFERLNKLLTFPSKSAPWEVEERITVARVQEDGREALHRLVAGLCPASEVDIYVGFNGRCDTKCIEANDWMAISENDLLSRVGLNTRELYPLLSARGELLGRVGVQESVIFPKPALISLHGIRCGGVHGLVGLMLAKGNNKNAQRTAALPAGSTEEWAAWARLVLKDNSNLNQKMLLRLHPIISDMDLPVWWLNGKYICLSEIVDFLKLTDKVIVHEGLIEHEDRDDLGRDRFDGGLKVEANVICVPRFTVPGKNSYFRWGADAHESLPWFLDVKPISYSGKLYATIRRVWGWLEEEEIDDFVVGDVGGVEILRSVSELIRGVEPEGDEEQ